MNSGIVSLFKRVLHLAKEPPIHPVDRRLAKEWIKRRLSRVYPELRDNPVALERAYRDLGLEARPGRGPNEAPTVFEVRLPGSVTSAP